MTVICRKLEGLASFGFGDELGIKKVQIVGNLAMAVLEQKYGLGSVAVVVDWVRGLFRAFSNAAVCQYQSRIRNSAY